MSNINNEQLFTDLTPEEGAVIEGGSRFELIGIGVEKAADQYDLYINFNGKRLFGLKTVYRGYYEVGTSKDFDPAGFLTVMDKDFWDSDDTLANERFSNTTPKGPGKLLVQGSGYKYTLDYNVT